MKKDPATHAALAYQAYERVSNTLSLVKALSTSEAFANTEAESCLESIWVLLEPCEELLATLHEALTPADRQERSPV